MMVHGTQLSSGTIELSIVQIMHLLLLPNCVCINRGLICEGWFEMLLCAYQFVMGGSRGGEAGGLDPPPPTHTHTEKSQKYRVSLQYWSTSETDDGFVILGHHPFCLTKLSESAHVCD